MFPIGEHGFSTQLQLLLRLCISVHPGRQQTWTEFLALGFGLAQAQPCEDLRSEIEGSPLSLALPLK